VKKRGSGLLLVLTVIVALGTVVQDYRFNHSVAREQSASLAIDQELAGLELALAKLRTAQAAYVAAGQGPDFWMTRADELAGAMTRRLEGLASATTSTDARGQYDTATRALAELMSLDSRARSHVRNDERLFASDLVFMEAMDVVGRLDEAIGQARTAEQAAADARLARYASLQLGMNALALGFVLVVMFYFARASGDQQPDAQPRADSPARALAELAAAPAPVVAPPPRPTPQQPSIAPPLPKAEPAVSLSGAADLCVDLARLLDGRDLHGLMERAAKVLYAKGVVLWMLDADGTTLQPTLAHGYSEKVLARLGTLPVDADNVTSLAFRTLQPQKMKSPDRGGAGAVAVPLINAKGGVGVLSAEIRSATPDDQMMSVARIVAAQLSSLVAAPEAGNGGTGERQTDAEGVTVGNARAAVDR